LESTQKGRQKKASQKVVCEAGGVRTPMAITSPATPKAKRLSVVAVVGGVLAVLWGTTDWLVAVEIPDYLVSSITSLAMLIAGFYDFKRDDDVVIYNGDD